VDIEHMLKMLRNRFDSIPSCVLEIRFISSLWPRWGQGI